MRATGPRTISRCPALAFATRACTRAVHGPSRGPISAWVPGATGGRPEAEADEGGDADAPGAGATTLAAADGVATALAVVEAVAPVPDGRDLESHAVVARAESARRAP